MTEPSSKRVHASCVAVNHIGVLIRGPSGSGKSSLALRLIDEGGILVADDQTIIETQGSVLLARAPATILGKLEVRGLGIIDMSACSARLGLVVDITSEKHISRLPDEKNLAIFLCEQLLPRIDIDATKADATARIRVAISKFTSVVEEWEMPLVQPSNKC
jgi:serine kinase of HPr protein (carbohydrate metabolism regulator)